jgi:hypothetical protein
MGTLETVMIGAPRPKWRVPFDRRLLALHRTESAEDIEKQNPELMKLAKKEPGTKLNIHYVSFKGELFMPVLHHEYGLLIGLERYDSRSAVLNGDPGLVYRLEHAYCTIHEVPIGQGTDPNEHVGLVLSSRGQELTARLRAVSERLFPRILRVEDFDTKEILYHATTFWEQVRDYAARMKAMST